MSHFYRVVKTIHMSHRSSPLSKLLGILLSHTCDLIFQKFFAAVPIQQDISVSSVTALAIIEPK